MQFAIGRPIGGVFLNGIEYLLDDDGDVKTFNDRDSCLEFITDTFGIEGDDAADYVFEYDENKSLCE